MATLYRQYRPQRFAELVGQDHVSETLRRAIIKDKLAHAYLLYGPRGTGKTTTARLLAKAVNCLALDQGEPCGKCASCQAVVAGNHPDVIEIDAASNRGIDDVRFLREAAKFIPGLGQMKVYIIDEVHMLTKEAASALLKTLEEPPRHALFILATTELHKVLATIASRCQIFRFRRATNEEMRQRLTDLLKREERAASGDVLAYIIERSDGCYRDAESLLGQLLTLGGRKITLDKLTSFLGLPAPEVLEDFLAALVREESAPALRALDEAFAAGVDPEQFLKEAVRYIRDGALYAAGEESQENQSRLAQWAQSLPQLASRAPVIMRALIQALQDLAFVPQPLMAVQLAIITVCTRKGEVRGEVKQAAKSAPAKAAKTKQPAATNRLGDIKKTWPRLIESVKAKNPVAATFLRAIEPADMTDDVLTVKAHYSLHKTFFDKIDNKQMITEELGKLLQANITMSFVLEEAETESIPPTARRNEREDKFVAAVREVFG